MPKTTNPAISFQQSLKPASVEEFIDFYFYRRVAHLLVPLFMKLGLSPNQVTTLSMTTGIVGSYFILKSSFMLGALLCMTAIFFDCCDGQIARLTQTSSALGRMLDGVCDLIWVACFWLAIYFSGIFAQTGHERSILILMCLSGFSTILHCWRFDGIRIQYFKIIDPKLGEKDLSLAESKALFKTELKRFNLLAALLAGTIHLHTKYFVSGNHENEKPVPAATRNQMKALLEPAMRQWPWLGEGHHLTLLLIGAFLAEITPNGFIAAFWWILIPFNLWWFYCEWVWAQRMKMVREILAQ